MIDIIRLKEIQKDFEERVRIELRTNTQTELIQYLRTSFFESAVINKKIKRKPLQSPRVLNNWEKEGLIDKINSSEGKSRKFNRIQSIWLELITILREFGYSLEKIKILKDSLLKSSIKGFSPFEYAIMHSIIDSPLILMVFEDGEFSLPTQSAYLKYIQEEVMKPHININLLNLTESEFPNNNYQLLTIGENRAALSPKELALIYHLRTGDFETVKVKLKDGDILMLEGSKKIPRTSRILDIIRSGGYQNIEIITEEGNIVNFQLTQKFKLKDSK